MPRALRVKPTQPTPTLPLPDTIRIGALDYKVKRWDARAADNSEAYGMCDRSTCTILIREGMPPQKEAEVLWHEVLHAAYAGAGLHMEDGYSEERIVLSLAFQLLQVLRDNPALIAFTQGAFAR